MRLKPNAGAEFTRIVESEILPLLRKQKGFTDEVTFVACEGKNALAISFWDRKKSADNYARDTYPQVMSILAAVVEGAPVVQAYEVASSTLHEIAAYK